MPDRATVRIGIFGGAFDPPHLGHVQVARDTTSTLALDHLLWIPTGAPALQKGRALSAGHHRARMCELCCAAEPKWTVDRRELERDGRSFTVDTLRALGALDQDGPPPRDRWFLLIGDDQLAQLHLWHRIDEWIDDVQVVAYPRGDFDPDAWRRGTPLPPPAVQRILDSRLAAEKHPASSTVIRAAVAAGQHPAPWLLPEVARYLRLHGLYAYERALARTTSSSPNAQSRIAPAGGNEAS